MRAFIEGRGGEARDFQGKRAAAGGAEAYGEVEIVVILVILFVVFFVLLVFVYVGLENAQVAAGMRRGRVFLVVKIALWEIAGFIAGFEVGKVVVDGSDVVVQFLMAR